VQNLHALLFFDVDQTLRHETPPRDGVVRL